MYNMKDSSLYLSNCLERECEAATVEADDILFGLNIQQFILQHQSALMDTRKVTKRSCSCGQGQAEHGKSCGM